MSENIAMDLLKTSTNRKSPDDVDIDDKHLCAFWFDC